MLGQVWNEASPNFVLIELFRVWTWEPVCLGSNPSPATLELHEPSLSESQCPHL